MIRHLNVCFSTTDDGRPLVTIENFPGLFAEFRTEQLREFARRLNDIANDACHGVEGARTYPVQEPA